MSALRVGDVIRVWERRTNPAKFKRHICICPDSTMFLRINSKALFPPHLLIRADGASFLDHDSYVELQQLIRPLQFELQQADRLGRLTPTHVEALKIAISGCTALSDETKEYVLARLARY